MILKNQQNILGQKQFTWLCYSKFLQTIGFEWPDPAKFNLDKYDDISLSGCLLEIDLEHPKELQEFHNDYPLIPETIEIKREMSYYQLKIADDCNISINNFKKLVPNFLNKEKHVLHY